MRRIDFEEACEEATDVYDFCEKLSIDVYNYDYNIMWGETAIEYIKEKCDDYLNNNDFDGLETYIHDQYKPNWDDICYEDSYGDICYFSDDELEDFIERVKYEHMDDPDWNEGDEDEDDWEEDDLEEDDKPEENNESKKPPLSFHELQKMKAQASESARERLSKLF